MRFCALMMGRLDGQYCRLALQELLARLPDQLRRDALHVAGNQERNDRGMRTEFEEEDGGTAATRQVAEDFQRPVIPTIDSQIVCGWGGH